MIRNLRANIGTVHHPPLACSVVRPRPATGVYYFVQPKLAVKFWRPEFIRFGPEVHGLLTTIHMEHFDCFGSNSTLARDISIRNLALEYGSAP